MLSVNRYYRYDLSVDEAIELGKRAITHAAHRDAMSGGMNNGTHSSSTSTTVYSAWRASSVMYFFFFFIVYHVGENGWTQVWRGDTNDMFYGYYPLKENSSSGKVSAEAMETA